MKKVKRVAGLKMLSRICLRRLNRTKELRRKAYFRAEI
jgi:hypothetical protein